MYWGVSKDQLIEFRKIVRQKIKSGQLVNSTLKDREAYADDMFNDPDVGPNMHQVTEQVIKPLTREGVAPISIPGLSYALMCNLLVGGLQCQLFISHAWNEGVFEMIANALAAWPEGCEGAYICCLSNPQNLNIGELLGSEIEQSPFSRILCHSPPPKKFVMLANCNTAIHSRLW